MCWSWWRKRALCAWDWWDLATMPDSSIVSSLHASFFAFSTNADTSRCERTVWSNLRLYTRPASKFFANFHQSESCSVIWLSEGAEKVPSEDIHIVKRPAMLLRLSKIFNKTKRKLRECTSWINNFAVVNKHKRTRARVNAKLILKKSKNLMLIACDHKTLWLIK